MGEKPVSEERISIERVDVDKGYSPENCIWANDTIQARNKSNVKKYSYKGESLCVTDLAEKYDLPRATLSARIRVLNWSLEKSIETPVRKFIRNTPLKSN